MTGAYHDARAVVNRIRAEMADLDTEFRRATRPPERATPADYLASVERGEEPQAWDPPVSVDLERLRAEYDTRRRALITAEERVRIAARETARALGRDRADEAAELQREILIALAALHSPVRRLAVLLREGRTAAGRMSSGHDRPLLEAAFDTGVGNVVPFDSGVYHGYVANCAAAGWDLPDELLADPDVREELRMRGVTLAQPTKRKR
jgi:DNA repair ATPase RecN